MGLLSSKNKKSDKKGKKNIKDNGQDSKFIFKPGKVTGFVKKQGSRGAQRGS